MKQPKSRPKMSEVVEILGSIMNETVPVDEYISQAVVETGEEEKEVKLSVEDTEAEPAKQGNNYLKKVFEFRDWVGLRNKSIGRLDWKSWAPGLVRTW